MSLLVLLLLAQFDYDAKEARAVETSSVGSSFVEPEAGSINRRQSEKFRVEQSYGNTESTRGE